MSFGSEISAGRPLQESVAAIPQLWLPEIEDLQEWLSRWVLAHNAHDIEELLSLVSPNLVWDDPAMFGQKLVGRESFREMLHSSFQAFPDLHVEQGAPMFGTVIRTVAVPWRLRGTFSRPLRAPAVLGTAPPKMAPTGRRIDVSGVDIYEFENTLLVRCETNHDMFTLSRQLGLVPNPSSWLVRLSTPLQWLGAAIMRHR